MAASGYVIKDATVFINGSDVSDLIREVAVNRKYADVDATGMRSDGAMEHKNGLRDDSFALVAKSSFGAAGLDEILEALFEDEDEFEVTVNPHPLPTALDNPQYQGTCLLQEYTPISGAVGALSTTPLTLPCQGRIAKVFT
jgi:hypothetical protein